jgi:hypothetical protein
MRATTIMFLAVASVVAGNWANGKKAVPSAKAVVEFTFVIIVIAALDQGETASLAKGFAWLFLAATLLAPDSILSGLAKAGTGTTTTKAA